MCLFVCHQNQCSYSQNLGPLHNFFMVALIWLIHQIILTHDSGYAMTLTKVKTLKFTLNLRSNILELAVCHVRNGYCYRYPFL